MICNLGKVIRRKRYVVHSEGKRIFHDDGEMRRMLKENENMILKQW